MKNNRTPSRRRRLHFEPLETREMLSLQAAMSIALSGLKAAGVPILPPIVAGPISPIERPEPGPITPPTPSPSIPLDPTRVAIGGDGFFIARDRRGEWLYTRNADFRLDKNHRLTTADGLRVYGYEVDANFEVDRRRLVQLEVPIGQQGATATTQISFTGVLTPLADIGEGTTLPFVVYDSNGNAVNLVVSAELAAKDGNSTTFHWRVLRASNSTNSPDEVVGNGDLVFDGTGHVFSGSIGRIHIPPAAGIAAIDATANFDRVAGLAIADSFGNSKSTLRLRAQNGFPVGTLRHYSVNEQGELIGHFDNGMTRLVGQFALASFPDPFGLEARGGGNYAATRRAGERTIGDPGASHFGNTIAFGAGDAIPAEAPFGIRYPWQIRSVQLEVKGAGYFIVEDRNGRLFYTREREFHLDINQRLATPEGLVLLGHDSNADYQLDTHRLAPLDVPIGATTSQATRQVFFSGMLSPADNVADWPGIVESDMLGDGTLPFPEDPEFGVDDLSIIEANGAASLDPANYSYHVTFYDSVTGAESRPTPRIGPVSISDIGRQIHIDNIPQPTGTIFDAVRIYRNTENDSQSFYLIETLTLGETSFTDGRPDAAIRGNRQLDLIGPKINAATKLVDVVRWTGTKYEHPFVAGTLTFTGQRGERSLAAETLEINSSTTVAELLELMEHALAIERSPVVPSAVAPGGSLVDGRLRFVSNAGIANEIQIPLSSFMIMPRGATYWQPKALPFQSTVAANGGGATADFIVFNSHGDPIAIRVTTLLTATNGNAATYQWFAILRDETTPQADASRVVGNGIIAFDAAGNRTTDNTPLISIPHGENATKPLVIELDFRDVSTADIYDNFGNSISTLIMVRQDGYPLGTLETFHVSPTGLVTGRFDHGVERTLGQVVLAELPPPRMLRPVGNGLFVEAKRTRPVQIGRPGERLLGLLRQLPPAMSLLAHELTTASVASSMRDVEEEVARIPTLKGASITRSTAISLDDELSCDRIYTRFFAI